MDRVIDSFMEKVNRTVNRTFSDVQVEKRFYQVDPKLRGDRVQVRFDPFSTWDRVKIYNLSGTYLGTGKLHHRQTAPPADRPKPRGKPAHSYTELLIRRHKEQLAEQTGGIDYRKVVSKRNWPFHEFAKTVAQLLGRKAALTDLSAGELEILKKVYNQSLSINRSMVKQAFERAYQPNLAHIVAELKQLITKKGD
jgi:hypothetical protein